MVVKSAGGSFFKLMFKRIPGLNCKLLFILKWLLPAAIKFLHAVIEKSRLVKTGRDFKIMLYF